jgi:HK97 family phage prohead protease
VPCTIRAVAAADAEGADRILEFIASTDGVASDGMIVEATAWDISRFTTAGAILWAHNRYDDRPPIGVPVSTRTEGGKLLVRARMAKAADYPFADQVYRLAKDGILRAVSVGFRIHEMRDANDAEKAKDIWAVVTKAELFEVSVVPVPADAGALITAVRSALDAKHVTREDLEAIVAQSKGTAWEAQAAAIRAAAGEAPAPAPVEPPKARKRAAGALGDCCAALRDLSANLRAGCDFLDECIAEMEAEDAGEPADPAAKEAAKAAHAAELRAAVEAATAPLKAQTIDYVAIANERERVAKAKAG